MNAVDYILDGLEAALELERELGVRVIECDRALLVPAGGARADDLPVPSVTAAPAGTSGVAATVRLSRPTASADNGRRPVLDYVFIHDRPLSPKGVEMMAKTITALGKTAETAPVVVAPPIPEARTYVFLGAKALAKYQPEVRLAENAWGKSAKGRDILLVRSPEEIVRFTTVTPAIKKIKQGMWTALKQLQRRMV